MKYSEEYLPWSSFLNRKGGLQKVAAVSGKRKRNKINKDNAGYFFIAPYFIVFLTFTLYPILYTFKLSFMSWDGFGEQQFIGLANYQRLLQDQMFIKSIGNTIFIALLAMIPQMVFGLVLAFLLNQKKLRGSNFFKTVFYFPNLVTAVSLGVLFSLLFDWKAGSVNQVLMTLHIIKDPINWKGSPLLSQLIVALVLFWQYFGYYTIIFTAGIRGIPYELFEAAEVDGASKVQTFFRIVLPLMRPIMTFAFVTSIIGGLQIFDLPYTFGGAMGGTKDSLLTMVMYMYNICIYKFRLWIWCSNFIWIICNYYCIFNYFHEIYNRKEEAVLNEYAK